MFLFSYQAISLNVRTRPNPAAFRDLPSTRACVPIRAYQLRWLTPWRFPT